MGNSPCLQVPTEAFAKVIDPQMITNQQIDMLKYPYPQNQNRLAMKSGVKEFRCFEQIAFLASFFQVRYIFSNDLSNIKKHPAKRKEKTFSQKYNRKERIEQFQKIDPTRTRYFVKSIVYCLFQHGSSAFVLSCVVIQDASCTKYSSFWLRDLGEQANNKPDSSLGSDFPEYQLGNNRSKINLIDLYTYQTE
jgi:hypothetical protein